MNTRATHPVYAESRSSRATPRTRLLVYLLIVLFAFSQIRLPSYADDPPVPNDPPIPSGSPISVSGNLLKVTTAGDFSHGTLEDLVLLQDVGDGALTLESGAVSGRFYSAVCEVAAFEYMVASWSATIPDGTEIEVSARVRRDDGTWTQWLSWGPYSPHKPRGSKSNKEADGAWIVQDIFELDVPTRADALQICVELRSDHSDVAPVLRQVAMTFGGGDMTPTYAETPLAELPQSKLIASPAYSQVVRHPSIDGSICSPTTIGVLLGSRAMPDLLPEELALNLRDEGEGIFGNWSFSVSGTGLYGYTGYAQYASKEILLQELAQGRTVGISVQYSNSQSGSYPYLEGAYGSTGGHLITLVGYEYEGGVVDDDHLYFYSADSFSASDATSFHRYKWTQLDAAWVSRMAYIVPTLVPEVSAKGIKRVEATILPDPMDSKAFTLVSDDQPVTSLHHDAEWLFAYTVEGIKTDMTTDQIAGPASIVYPHPLPSEANNTFFYDVGGSDYGAIILDTDRILRRHDVPIGESKEITVYAINNRGYLYKASMTVERLPDPVIVASTTTAVSSQATGTFVYDAYECSLMVEGLGKRTVNGVEGYYIDLGFRPPAGLIPSSGDPDWSDVVVVVDGELSQITSTTYDAHGNPYAVATIPVTSDSDNVQIRIGWTPDDPSTDQMEYKIMLSDITYEGDEVTVDGNLVSVDFNTGRMTNGLRVDADGVLHLDNSEIEAAYYSPIYDAFDWEYAVGNLMAYTPGTSSVELQIRAFTQAGNTWSDWYSFGRIGAGYRSTSYSASGDYVSMDTDVFKVLGSYDTANAKRFQLRLILRSDESAHRPAVYGAGITFKKDAYGIEEAIYTGSIDVGDLPKSAISDIFPTSAYLYAGGTMKAWRFENLALMLLNGKGADLLFEEVAFAALDDNGWGNWTFTNMKPGLFGHEAYTQYGARTTLVKQALAEGYLVGLFVHGGKIPSTNSSGNSQTLVYGYKTADDGTVTFLLVCPRGDAAELAGGNVYGTCTEVELNEAIQTMSNASARGLMYVVGPKKYASSWLRENATATLRGDGIALTAGSVPIGLSPHLTAGAISSFGNGGYIIYQLDRDRANAETIATGKLYYDAVVRADGTISVPDTMKAELARGGGVTLFVVRNHGVTYVAHIEGQPPAPDPGQDNSSTVTTDTTTTETAPTVQPTVQPTAATTATITPSDGGTASLQMGVVDGQSVAQLTVKPEQGFVLDRVRVYDADGKRVKLERSGERIFFPANLLNTRIELEFSQPLADLPFNDTVAGSWYDADVNFVVRKSLMKGTPAGDFRPDDTVTRGMGATVLHRLAGSPSGSDATTFSDVAAGRYDALAIAWAQANTIMNGYGDNRFGADDVLTREQFALILLSFARKTGIVPESAATSEADAAAAVSAMTENFRDAGDISGYAREAMAWAVEHGLLLGTDGKLNPRAAVTRAQFAAVIHRFYMEIFD